MNKILISGSLCLLLTSVIAFNTERIENATYYQNNSSILLQIMPSHDEDELNVMEIEIKG